MMSSQPTTHESTISQWPEGGTTLSPRRAWRTREDHALPKASGTCHTVDNSCRRMRWSMTLCVAIVCAGAVGCAMPAFAKAKKPKIDPDHFSCGENCPKSARHVPAQ